MLTWPRPGGDFSDLQAIEACFIGIALALAPCCQLIISVGSAAQRDALQTALAAHAKTLRIYVVPSNDVWVRDHGPIGVLRDGRCELLNFDFDGWGQKYPCADDQALVARLGALGAFAGQRAPQPQGWVLEGGAIETDGCGTLLATRSSVLDPRRNPELDQSTVEALLREALGLHHFHWLSHGQLAGDDTDGHIDTLARFVSPGDIVYQACDDPSHPSYDSLQALALELAALRRVDGSPYAVHALPWPRSASGPGTRPLPASYANFLLLNGRLFVPLYADPADATALEVLRRLCPQYQVCGLDCSALIEQYGSLHCATMNLPAAPQ